MNRVYSDNIKVEINGLDLDNPLCGRVTLEYADGTKKIITKGLDHIRWQRTFLVVSRKKTYSEESYESILCKEE
jgi:hypothetical protein